MLRGSFSSKKLKTATNLTLSRIKVVRNLAKAKIESIKRELVRFMKSQEDQTAMIQVENLVREQKATNAYDLLEIFCKQVSSNIIMIETQKNCPGNLKEAIASVVFACPRCSNLPELMEVKEQFGKKYGKEFVSCAVELRSNSGVCRKLVENLSPTASDGPTKVKLLSAIAKEHNIKWEYKPYSEPNDLLGGPSNFKEASDLLEKGKATFQPPRNQVNANENATQHGLYNSSLSCPNIEYSGDQSPTKDTVASKCFSLNDWKSDFKTVSEAAEVACEAAAFSKHAAAAAAEFSRIHNLNNSSANMASPSLKDTLYGEESSTPKFGDQVLKEGLNEKPSHIHPNLPDYDDLVKFMKSRVK